MQICTYLFFNRNCEEAFRFYEKLLGGKIVALLRHRDVPDVSEESANWGDLVMHAYMTVGDRALMGSDDPTDSYRPPTGFYVQLAVDEPEEATRIFDALAEGGKVALPLGKTSWAEKFGMLVDRFGIPWMINYAPNA